jgi:hypothetical protein
MSMSIFLLEMRPFLIMKKAILKMFQKRFAEA